jgi:enoyl-CoA hydratase/carnithine racemase
LQNYSRLTIAATQKINFMKFKYLNLDTQQKVTTITINRPEKGNSLSPDVLTELHSAFKSIAKDAETNVIIFTGGEKYFSAGFDLSEIRKLEKVSNESYTELFHKAYRAVLFCEQPVICAIGGPAIAGGFDLTMMSDIRYASTRAKFGQREVPLALTPIMDPLWRIVGLGVAKELALTGRIYDAEEAERIRYVSKVFPEGELLKNVGEIACEMASYDRSCLVETKRLSNQLLHQDLDSSMRIQEWLFRTYIGSEENHLRIDALQKSLAEMRQKKSK